MLVIYKVTKSPLASEAFVFCEAADAGVLIAVMLQEIFRRLRLPDILCKTNKASGSNFSGRVDVAKVKEMMEKKEI